jgi:hypothetical protein
VSLEGSKKDWQQEQAPSIVNTTRVADIDYNSLGIIVIDILDIKVEDSQDNMVDLSTNMVVAIELGLQVGMES